VNLFGVYFFLYIHSKPPYFQRVNFHSSKQQVIVFRNTQMIDNVLTYHGDKKNISCLDEG